MVVAMAMAMMLVGGNAARLPSRISSERGAAVGGGWWVVVMERVGACSSWWWRMEMEMVVM